MDMMIRVAVDNATLNFDKLYTYRVPETLQAFVAVGVRVVVPFGKGAPRMAVILELGSDDIDPDKIKSIGDIERDGAVLTQELVQLILFLHETTLCTYYDALRSILPKMSRLTAKGNALVNQKHTMETVYKPADLPTVPSLTDRQHQVLQNLQNKALTAAQLHDTLGVSRAVLEKLTEKGILLKIERKKQLEENDGQVFGTLPVLSDAQQKTYTQIVQAMQDPEKPRTTLLFGVTSSGKTAIYQHLMEKTARGKKSSLLLVPEIALATQMIRRLREYFGSRIAIIHSALNDTERQRQWDKIRSGHCDIVVGTRSAVFAPVCELGLIIVDEEQEQSYISEQTPRYAALQVAQFRSRMNGCPLLLASATPSIESFHRAKVGEYNLFALRERYMDMPLPTVKVMDMRNELLAGNSHYISRTLKEQIDQRLAVGQQCILLLNRRGYRPLSLCSKCKTIVKCQDCDAPLVLHRSTGMYQCHYCGQMSQVQDSCRVCSGEIKHTGIGTQKIEEDLEALFPNARILRFDLDTVAVKNAAEKMLNGFSRGEYDIIIGTQMIAKGLDFPRVTLVGVLSIDQLLLMPSYRANERTFSMLTQVIGRSGRGDREGQAVIQTVDPENEIIRMASRQDYEAFYGTEIVMRRAHLYPPFCSICMAGLVADSEDDARKASAAFADIMRTVHDAQYAAIPIRLLGPVPMRVAYMYSQYRYRIVIKYRPGRDFRDYLRDCLARYSEIPIGTKVRIFIDLVGEPDN